MRWEVFYYTTDRGNSPIEDFLDTLPRKAKAKCIAYIDMLEEFGFTLPRSIIAKVRGDVWELRPEWGGTEYRFLYFSLVKNRIVILHALTKKTQKLKSKDIEIAKARAKDLRGRSPHEGPSKIRKRAN